MFSFIRSKEEKEIEEHLRKLKLNMSNNYKDAAQDNFRRFKAALDAGIASGKIRGKKKEEYMALLDEYEKKLQGFTHKDQKPYWTKQ